MLSACLKPLIVVLLAGVAASAQVVYGLQKLVDKSDVVANITVISTVQVGAGAVTLHGYTYQTRRRQATFRVNCAIKGKLSVSELTVPYVLLYSPGGWGGGVPEGYSIGDPLTPGSSKLIFLKRMRTEYEFTNGSYLGMVVASDCGCTASANPFASTVSSVIRVLFSRSASEQERTEALFQLGATDEPSIVAELKRFMSVEPAYSTLYMRAVTAILAHQDLSVANQASALLDHIPQYNEAVVNLLFAVGGALPPWRAVPILRKGFASPAAMVRSSAAQALYQTDSRLAIPALLTDLEDPDPGTAFAVMQGLGNLTKQYEWRPKTTEASADWFRCLSHWREFRQDWKPAR
jgi:hypothetical protein